MKNYVRGILLFGKILVGVGAALFVGAVVFGIMEIFLGDTFLGRPGAEPTFWGEVGGVALGSSFGLLLIGGFALFVGANLK